MKLTDYCPRAAPMDAYLNGTDLIGAEIGVDAGAHAEALLTYCSIKKLYLIDIWDTPFPHAYMLGRLETKGFKNNIECIATKSKSAAGMFNGNPQVDFIYFDQLHDYNSVKTDLEVWFPLLKEDGIIGYRNYDVPTVKKACDEFVKANNLFFKIETNEIIIACNENSLHLHNR
jgi:hypothetical protein